MCGFSAIVDLGNKLDIASAIERMGESIAHRGPDARGFFCDGKVALAFRRLAILDLSPAANQPMESEDGNYVLVFNGEIYNFIELRADLEKKGHLFKSSGDTEVLLKAFTEWGWDCLPRLNGMWAFLIYDKRERKIYGSRDRFGVKPLFIHHQAEAVILASEIKAIRASRLYHGDVNWAVAAKYLLEGAIDGEDDTFFSDIRRVPAGIAFEIDRQGRYREWKYWQLPDLDPSPIQNPVEEFIELFESAVALRLRSDVPVGTFLSGGLDSTSIICEMARKLPHGLDRQPLKAFCYMDARYDERNYIAETLKDTHAELHRLKTDPILLWDSFDEMLWYQDEPVQSITPLVGFHLCRNSAVEGVKVILNGQGADEVMGGYSDYFVPYWITTVFERGLSVAYHEIIDYGRKHRKGASALFQQVLIKWLVWKLNHTMWYPFFRKAVRRNHGGGGSLFCKGLQDVLVREHRAVPPIYLDPVLRYSVERHDLPLYLRVEDRNSMANGIEIRLPFLDFRLVSFMMRLGANWKLRGPWNKYLLRKAMTGKIPDLVRTRVDKMGFPTSFATWLRGPLYESCREIILSKSAHDRGIYNLGAIEKKLVDHKDGKIDASADLFRIVQFELWCRSVVEKPDYPRHKSFG